MKTGPIFSVAPMPGINPFVVSDEGKRPRLYACLAAVEVHDPRGGASQASMPQDRAGVDAGGEHCGGGGGFQRPLLFKSSSWKVTMEDLPGSGTHTMVYMAHCECWKEGRKE
ncbi:hypothetical protein GALMADRAFT_1236424 [Galerina marginata CBS 339.88]|uniref:Uncharacterized protein n=1 Tax=Galerina marginata (strain CBS 339.88) TaxID=685588 RepID=A0A067T8B5_GALM3|nr:hypothetical protein GALMADRAFT_1236424 [Galerina marginata CBS 339.88]